jgi:uncharacterized membrane protein YhiD involved in acid resistance
MESPYARIGLRLLAALSAGRLIGLDHGSRGRQAGFREHTLVCLATCQLMLMGVYDWTDGDIAAHPHDNSASHMVQGIMWLSGGRRNHQRGFFGQGADDRGLN